MAAPPPDERVRAVAAVLAEAQRRGFLGARPVDEVVEHAQAFVAAVRAHPTVAGRRTRVVDLGSGGGVPGLVVAAVCENVNVSLVDRRGQRTDFLSQMVRKLGWSTQVTVLEADTEHLRRDPDWRHLADVVTARGFGPPSVTLETAADLVRTDGWIVISEPPPGSVDRWNLGLLKKAGVERVVPAPPGTSGVAVFTPAGR